MKRSTTFQKFMKKRNTKGFTLIELMVVIVVLGVLSAAAVPMYLGYRDDARRAEARGGTAAIVTAMQYYKQANGDYEGADPDAILQRADVEELEQNWDCTVYNIAANGFSVGCIANNGWVNRDGAPLSMVLNYNGATGEKTWVDDTGFTQVSTAD